MPSVSWRAWRHPVLGWTWAKSSASNAEIHWAWALVAPPALATAKASPPAKAAAHAPGTQDLRAPAAPNSPKCPSAPSLADCGHCMHLVHRLLCAVHPLMEYQILLQMAVTLALARHLSQGWHFEGALCPGQCFRAHAPASFWRKHS